MLKLPKKQRLKSLLDAPDVLKTQRQFPEDVTIVDDDNTSCSGRTSPAGRSMRLLPGHTIDQHRYKREDSNYQSKRTSKNSTSATYPIPRCRISLTTMTNDVAVQTSLRRKDDLFLSSLSSFLIKSVHVSIALKEI